MGSPEAEASDLPVLTKTVAAQLELAIQLCQAQAEKACLPVISLIDYCERFTLWARGNGALHSSRTQVSLAHRVRDAPELATLFRDLLNDILDDLNQLYTPVTHPNTTSETSPIRNIEPKRWHGTINPESFDRCLCGVEDSLELLFKASRATKQAAQRDRFQTALNKTTTDEGGNEDQRNIKLGELFPRLRDPQLSSLRERLSAACNARNRYLLHRQRHQQNISAGDLVPKTEAETFNGIVEADARSTVSNAEPTAIEELNFALKDTSSISSGSVLSYLTDTGKDLHFKVLDLQRVHRGRSDFLCPYCCTEQSLDNSQSYKEQQKWWEKHVFADLKAYVCPDARCTSHLFEDSHSWLRHQLSTHLKEWRCRDCNADDTFETLEDLKHHYVSQHRLVDEDEQFRKLAQAGEVSPRTISVASCKFCKWSENLPKDVDRVPTSRYRKHVCKHLEQIALAMVAKDYRMLNDSNDDDDIDSVNDDNQSSSTIDANAAVYNGENALRKHEEVMITLIHLLAMKPTSTLDLMRTARMTNPNLLEELLDKVARLESEKWKLLDRSYKRLTVWDFAYETQEDRQMAIDNAIKAYDRMRIGAQENLWQLLLPQGERGKRILLSRLHLDAPGSLISAHDNANAMLVSDFRLQTDPRQDISQGRRNTNDCNKMLWNPSAVLGRIYDNFVNDENTTPGSTDLSIKDDVGMQVVSDGCVNASDGFDIVFVHGLRGSRISTFSSGKYFWLRELLAQHLDDVRILTWGYDADIAKAFSFSSQESITGHAKTLLDDLVKARRLSTQITRPIIFVCHSLGGLVVKDALINAALNNSHQRDVTVATIYTKTKGVLFFGTPHRGSAQEPLGGLVAKAAGLGLRRPNTQLLRSLRTVPHILEKQREDFITISKDLLIRCVSEGKPMNVGMIVPESSATFDGFNVQRGSIYANHIDMVKFSSKDDPGYQKFLGWVKQMMNEGVRNNTPDVSGNERPSPGATPLLHMAAASAFPGYLERTLREYQAGALLNDINARDDSEHNRTPLFMAIVGNVPQNVLLLLQAGADPNILSEAIPGKRIPLTFVAAALGMADCLEVLIRHGNLDPNMRAGEDNESTLLQAAAVNGKPDVVRKLLELGADPWLRDDRQRSVFEVATAMKDEEIMRLLTDATASRDQRLLPSSF